jgi:hypothetical protein
LKTPPNIIWLASYPKSGNTWFRVFLSNLFSGSDLPVSINALHATPIASARTIFDDFTGVSASDLSMDEIELLRPRLYREISANSDELVFQKVHDAWKRNSLGEALFPPEVTHAVIYFIRDPRDVAVSFAHHSSVGFEQMIKKMADPSFSFCEKENRLYNQLRQELSTWSGHVKSWVDDSGLPVMVLRYEDMIANTYTHFEKAVKYLGLKYSRAQIEKALKNSDFRQVKKMEEEEGFAEKPLKMKSFFREGKSGSYRDTLDEKLITKIETMHGEVMKRFGYL